MYGILVYEEKDAKHNEMFIRYMIDEANKMGISLKLMLYEKFWYGISENTHYVEYEGNRIEEIDFVIYRARRFLLSRQFEAMQIPVFNSSLVCEICNDKALTYQYIASLKIPMVESLFVENDRIREAVKNCREDVVVKAVGGHGGSQVCLVKKDNPSSLEEALRLIGKDRAVVQPLLKGRGQDLRVYVIGGRIVAAVLRSAVSGFKANFSLGGSVRLYELSEAEREIVNRITSTISLDYAGIDFIIGEEGELIFNEIEDVVGARMLYQCSELDIVSLYLQHIQEKVMQITGNHKHK